jgi:hypothetical protein
MGAPNQNVRDVLEQAFPEGAAIETQLRFLLRFAILAPSAKNSQPWAFSVRDNKVFVVADLGRSHPISDPDRRELYIGVGCALENLVVAAEHFGFQHCVSYFPHRWHSEVVASVVRAGRHRVRAYNRKRCKGNQGCPRLRPVSRSGPSPSRTSRARIPRAAGYGNGTPRFPGWWPLLRHPSALPGRC